MALLRACVALVCLASIAMAAPRASSGTINDMEHIVIFMQENRAFDHYYGVLNGVRGFNDRAHPRLPNGDPIFYQPAGDQSYILPFPLLFDKTSTQCMPAPEMAYESDINIFNGGLMDGWNTARDPGFGMSYFNRTDLPFYYALADAFTIGDQYYQSTFTATNPNRQHLFTGSNGLSVPNSGFCMLDDTEYTPGFLWETMAETLQKANVSWRVIQEVDNFDDNAFEWFKSFQDSRPGEPLFDYGVLPVLDLVDGFEELIQTDTLPSVLWIVGPTKLSEHAENHPGDGEDLTHRLVSVLSKPEYAAVYAKTAFILNYDEGGQFFDHHWTPTPPRSGAEGLSTVTTEGELTLVEEFNIPRGNPIGLGFRVPLMIVSPWTRGHLVYSEVSDHTSVIKLIEKRFGVRCPNISPWRRAVVSDLTAAFDFTAPDYTWPASFPDTSQNVNMSKWECDNLPAPTLPTDQFMPTQEPGTRVSRPLPYEFVITDDFSTYTNLLQITMNNTGAAGAVFYVFDLINNGTQPRKYTVEGGKALSDNWQLDASGRYDLSLHGPNGFVRRLTGNFDASTVSASMAYLKTSKAVNITLSVKATNDAGECDFALVDNAYGAGPWTVRTRVGVDPGSQVVAVDKSGNWYDVTATLINSPTCPINGTFSRRFMGRMEDGTYTTSDPAMATGVSPFAAPAQFAPVPEAYRTVEKWTQAKNCASRRSRIKDACWDPMEDLKMKHRFDRDEL